MDEIIVLKVVVSLLLPFFLVYVIYLLINSLNSPGGGFQAGLIFSTVFIAYSLVTSLATLQKIITTYAAMIMASIGILIYSGVGVVAMINGGRFLGYSALAKTIPKGQAIGIMIVEFGVGITVFSTMLLIFYSFGARSSDDSAS